MVLKIRCNPYLLQTDFWVDGEPARDAQWAKYMCHRRLQTWFYPANNWQGFGEELADALNEKKVTIEFEGRSVDYLDLKIYCQKWNKERKEKKDHKTRFVARCPKEVLVGDDDVMNELDRLLQTFPGSPVESMRDPKIREAYDHERSNDFEMAVVATMSSGKSTLINALLGSDLLPAANEATTAKITRIIDMDSAQKFTVACRNRDGEEIHARCEATAELLEEYNKDEDVFYVDMEGNIPNISSQILRLNILDTPGPNNSATQAHRDATYTVIKNTQSQPLILYIMDATKLGIDGDAGLLKDIAATIKEAETTKNQGQQAQDRFVFVLNRADALDTQTDGSVADIVKREQAYLQGLGISSTQIIPTSAYAAKVLRMEHGELPMTEDEEDDLVSLKRKLPRKHLDEASLLTPSCAEKLQFMKQKAEEENDEYTLNLIASGIIGLELTINEYLEKYAFPYKVRRVIDTFQKRLDEEHEHAKYTESIARNKQNLENARQGILEATSKKDELAGRRCTLEKRANGIKMEDKTFREYRRRIDVRVYDNLEKFLNRFNGGDKDDVSAKQQHYFLEMVSKARDEVLETVKTELKDALGKQLKQDFDPVYKIYEEALQSLQETGVGGVKFGMTESMKNVEEMLGQMSMTSLNDMVNMDDYTYEKTHTESGYEDNPDRQGFFGFFKFWKPKRVWVEREVSDGEFIQVQELFGRVAQNTEEEFSEQLESMKAGFNVIYQDKKKECMHFLDAMQAAFEAELRKIQELTQEVEENRADLAKNELCLAWMEDCQQKLSQVVRFERDPHYDPRNDMPDEEDTDETA